MVVLRALGSALLLAFSMFWDVLWPLVLGFLLSAAVQSLVPTRTVARTLGRPGLAGVAYASAFGAASSSCSYAAVAIARSLFRRGARLGNAILFEFASTNLVFELGLVLVALLGWQFWAAEFSGGVLMIGLLAIAFKLTLRQRMINRARAEADRGLQGRMEGHAGMDMTLAPGPLRSRLFSPQAFTAISHYFWMDVASIWQDLLLGFVIAGALGAWVPASFWQAFFLTHDPTLARFWGPLIGPVISMLSFVCSVGNVPLAAVLWNGGISFGGVIAFIFADLIILPIVNIHRKYYGWRMSLYLLGVSYLAMALAGFLIEVLFGALGIVPEHFRVAVLISRPGWNATTILDLIALAVAGLFGWRFLRTGGREMLRMMSSSGSGSGSEAHHQG